MIATTIKTDLWHTIIEDLQTDGWKITQQYEGMDAGIDYNAYTLKKEDAIIKFEWDNWSEGEIICRPEESLALALKYSLQFNDKR